MSSCNLDVRFKKTKVYYLCAEKCETINNKDGNIDFSTVIINKEDIDKGLDDKNKYEKIHTMLRGCSINNILIFFSSIHLMSLFMQDDEIIKETEKQFEDETDKFYKKYPDLVPKPIVERIEQNVNGHKEIITTTTTPPVEIPDHLSSEYPNKEDVKNKIISKKTNPYIKYINDAFENFVRGKTDRLLNVVIVNLTKSYDAIIYKLNDIKKNKYFKKIINIVPSGQYISDAKIRGIFEESYKKNDSSGSASSSITVQHSQDDQINREIIFKGYEVRDINGLELNNTWWYNYYMKTPFCFYYRLFQSSGTCWMNSTLNLFILLPPLVDILLEKFETYGKKKEIMDLGYNGYEELKKRKYELDFLLHIIIYNLLKNKNKPTTDNQDIIDNIGYHVKVKYTKGDEKSTIESGDGGVVVSAVPVILYVLKLYDKIDFIDFSGMSDIYTNNSGNLNYYVSDGNSYIDIKVDTDESVKNINKKQKIIKAQNSMYTKSKMYGNTGKLSFMHKKINIYLRDYMSKNIKDPKDILFIIGCIDSHKIYLDGYKLIGTIMGIGGHAIVGIYCFTDNNYYIYDSNGYIVQTDWPNDNIETYLNDVNKNVQGKGYSFQHTSCMVFIKTTKLEEYNKSK